MEPNVRYIWVGASCDYGSPSRESGAAFIIQQMGEPDILHSFADKNTTEFRMIFAAMLNAMDRLPAMSDIVFLTNVSYVQQHFANLSNTSANTDLIVRCAEAKKRHKSVVVKTVPFHKYPQLQETHNMAHAMMVAMHDK